MANTYTKIHVQFVFAVKYREGIIRNVWADGLYKYITGILQGLGHKMLAINGMPDHIHLLTGLRPTQSISDLLQDIKASSSKWINDRRFVKGRFEWQAGYGAFSYAASDIDNVARYIANQEIHHKKVSFRDEYLGLLKEFDVEFDEQYIFRELI
jgi:putative transposase